MACVKLKLGMIIMVEQNYNLLVSIDCPDFFSESTTILKTFVFRVVYVVFVNAFGWV